MAVTLAQAATLSQNDLQRGVIETFVQASVVLDRMPFMTVQGNAYAYNEESTLPGVAFRAVNAAYVDPHDRRGEMRRQTAVFQPRASPPAGTLLPPPRTVRRTAHAPLATSYHAIAREQGPHLATCPAARRRRGSGLPTFSPRHTPRPVDLPLPRCHGRASARSSSRRPARAASSATR